MDNTCHNKMTRGQRNKMFAFTFKLLIDKNIGSKLNLGEMDHPVNFVVGSAINCIKIEKHK